MPIDTFILFLIINGLLTFVLAVIVIIFRIRALNSEYRKTHDGLTKDEVEKLPERTEIVEIIAIRKNELRWNSEMQTLVYSVKFITENGEYKTGFISSKKAKQLLLSLGKNALVLKGNQIRDIDEFVLYESLRGRGNEN